MKADIPPSSRSGKAPESPASAGPVLAVVVSTRDRAPRLRRLLAALRAQTVDASEFVVVVVDNGSNDETQDVLEAEAERRILRLRTLRRSRGAGPGSARDEGWRATDASLIAFTDDDCEPAPGWLAAIQRASASSPGCFVQGRTEPHPSEVDRTGPFSRTMQVQALDPAFPTCNVAYPRELLERIDGFDVAAFDRLGGEDCDLGWRAIASGSEPVFCADALVHHAVNELGPLGKLRIAMRWGDAMKAYALHPRLRRATFTHQVFWKEEHYLLSRAVLAAILPRSLWPLRAWLVYPYLRLLWARGRVLGGGPLLAPYHLVYDLVEVASVVRAGIRHRVPMI